ncbi:polyketide synthase dehydratase domain-containing protein, partial [Streptomyces sp. NPDC047525]|uniref:SpnB-like Rossmann fold domain-containing protein n=1 Tax=Streptomyces sp. NPDC047525 TaxID=3155264 RepID=UPI0033EFD8D5
VLFAEVTLPEHAQEDAARFGLHPALLDAALHAQRFHEGFAAEGVWLPFTWNRVSLFATGAATIRVLLRSTGDDTVRVAAADPAGAPVALVEAMRLRKVDPSRLSAATTDLDGLFALEWFPAAAAESAPVYSAAVLGADPFLLGSALPGVVAHTDTAGLLASLDAGGALPQCAVLQIAAPEAVDVPAAAHELAEKLLLTVQAWVADERLESVPLVVVTRGAVGTGQGPDDPGVTDLSASVAWGLIRSAQTEHPDRFVLLDIETDTNAESGATSDPGWGSLLAFALSGSEPQLAVRKGELLAARLVRGVDGRQIAGVGGFGAGTDWRIDALGAGTFDDVGKAENPRATRPLEEGEIRLQVRAAGLNFMDVAGSLGLAKFEDGLGAEGAGVVVETGPGVTRFAVGDRVFGGFPSAFAP